MFEELFKRRNYTPEARPVLNKSEPVKVQMNIALAAIVALVRTIL